MQDSELFPMLTYSPEMLSPPAIDEQERNERCLLRTMKRTLGSLPAMQRAFDNATAAGGVLAATRSDYHLFEGVGELMDPFDQEPETGEPFDESPWTSQACSRLISNLAPAPVHIVSETVWVAEWQGPALHGFEVFLPRLLPDPTRTAWWCSASLNGLALLEFDDSGWLRLKGTKRAPYRIDYCGRATPWSILSFCIPRMGHPGHWPCRRRLSRFLIPLLLQLQTANRANDAAADHAYFQTAAVFSASRYVGEQGMDSMQ